jgi:hypothetical protein
MPLDAKPLFIEKFFPVELKTDCGCMFIKPFGLF